MKIETVVRDYDSYFRNYGELQYQSDKNLKVLKKKVTKLKNSNKQLMEFFGRKMDNYEKYTKLQLAENACRTLAKVAELFHAIRLLDCAEKTDCYYRGVIKGCKDSEAIYNNCKVKIKENCLEEEDYEKLSKID